VIDISRTTGGGLALSGLQNLWASSAAGGLVLRLSFTNIDAKRSRQCSISTNLLTPERLRATPTGRSAPAATPDSRHFPTSAVFYTTLYRRSSPLSKYLATWRTDAVSSHPLWIAAGTREPWGGKTPLLFTTDDLLKGYWSNRNHLDPLQQ
jgi:hypothetical protein